MDTTVIQILLCVCFIHLITFETHSTRKPKLMFLHNSLGMLFVCKTDRLYVLLVMYMYKMHMSYCLIDCSICTKFTNIDETTSIRAMSLKCASLKTLLNYL
jgi:hypothetical protein